MKPKLEPKPSTDSKSQIESELKRTRRELENTKNALKHQVARCRHLVSAFSKKLVEKDVELKHCKETREKQLSTVIRALLVLEARLRREQKSIRTMLAERDAVIKSQCEEISRLEAGCDPGWAAKLASRDAIIALRDEEIDRLRAFSQPSLDSLEEAEYLSKSLNEQSDRISYVEDFEKSEEIKKLLEEKDSQIKSQEEEIIRLKSMTLTDDADDKTDIKAILSERDAFIKLQQAEIERLRSLTLSSDVNVSKESNLTDIDESVEEETPNIECYAKPDLISSLCIDGQDEKESSESVTETACQPDSLSSDAASTRACLGDNDADSLCNCTITPPVVRGGLSVHDRSAFSPVPRSNHKYDSDLHTVNTFNNSAPDISKTSYIGGFDASPSSVHDSPQSSFYTSTMLTSPNSSRVSMRTFDINYQDNPVLQCVNQILLKDPDDIMEDQRSNKLPSIESPFVEIDDADQPFWLSNNTENETQADTTIETLEDSKPALATSSPLEKSNIQEAHPPKSCKLSLSKLIELHNAARKLFPSKREHDGRKSVSMSDLSSAVLNHRSNPPVPPKPRKSSGKKVDFNMNRPTESKSADNSFSNSKGLLPPQPVYIDRTKLDIISKPSPLPFAGTHNAESDQDNELYVISNSALDDEILQKLKGKNLKSFEIKLHRLAGEALVQQQARKQHSGGSHAKLHPNHKPTLNKAMLNNINLLEAAAMLRQLREASDPRRADGKQGMSPSMSQKARLRVAASVAQLLAQAQQQAREQQLRAQAELQMKAQAESRGFKVHSENNSKMHADLQAKARVEHHLRSQMKPAEHFRSPPEHHLKAHTDQPVLHLKTKIQQHHYIEDQPSTSNEPPLTSPPPPPLPSQPPPPLSPRDSPNLSQMSQRSDVSHNDSHSSESNQNPDPRPESSPKEGEASTSNVEKSPGTYDNFLEATGLSQKSIMTPSRMMNNHRNVVKPKDVKLRNKVRNAAIFERTIPSQVVGPTIKYWTEPYL